MQCPRCSQQVEPRGIAFTWWGGVLGQKLVNHVECPLCTARFNGKTGSDNKGAITIYLVVVSAIMIALVAALFVTVWKP